MTLVTSSFDFRIPFLMHSCVLEKLVAHSVLLVHPYILYDRANKSLVQVSDEES